MKCSPRGVQHRSGGAGAHAKVTELWFIIDHPLLQTRGGTEKKAPTLGDSANTEEESETFQFLADILPKTWASEYLKMLNEKREGENKNDDESGNDE
jgi:chromatin accessibility complex protein 1